MSYKITIDPGLSGTGYAIWNRNWKLGEYGIITSSKKIGKKYDLCFKLNKILVFYPVIEAYIEYPAKFSGVKGDMVANKGDLVKLASFVGYIEAFLNTLGINAHMVTVNEWKGQLPKKIVIKRIKRLLPTCKASSHDWDAIGIGLYLRGDF